MLRQAIMDIHADQTLSPSQKALRVQQLMNLKPSKPQPNNANNLDERPTYHTCRDQTRVFGCDHYRTNCKVLAECCQTWHPCRFCHDEWTEKNGDGHLMDRFAVKKMMCQYCHAVGDVNQTCACGKVMASYYCDRCKLFDDDPEKKIYHCDDCGLCRVGRRQDFTHCNRCHGCIDSSYYPNHRCLEGSLDASCPICGDQLFASIMPVMFMRCGHAIHSLCYHQHCRESIQCPVCCKSLGDMSELNRNIDVILSMSRMPPEYDNVMSEILCNDCERRCMTKYHFLYHKCSFCFGYNTKLIKSFAADQENSLVSSPMGISESDIIDGVEVATTRRMSSTPPLLQDIKEDSEED